MVNDVYMHTFMTNAMCHFYRFYSDQKFIYRYTIKPEG